MDAADLHLIFEPKIVRREDFTGGSKARIKPGHCTACGKCEELCRFNAIYFDGPGNGRVSRRRFALKQPRAKDAASASITVPRKPSSSLRPFAASGSSPRLVAGRWSMHNWASPQKTQGNWSRRFAEPRRRSPVRTGLELIICDGSPGIGCPVIASLTGASLALFVVEPTVSGVHDFRRVAQLGRTVRRAGHAGREQGRSE